MEREGKKIALCVASKPGGCGGMEGMVSKKMMDPHLSFPHTERRNKKKYCPSLVKKGEGNRCPSLRFVSKSPGRIFLACY